MQIERQNQNTNTRNTKSRIFQGGRLSQTEREIEQMANANRKTKPTKHILETRNLEYFWRGV